MSRARDIEERGKRLESRIHQIVASELEYNSKDPDLALVTVTAVKMTGDLQHADIYWTVLGSDQRNFAAEKALGRIKGRVRSALARNLNSRLAPTLAFKADALEEHVASIEDLLARAQAEDSRLARERDESKYAAGADAYKEADL